MATARVEKGWQENGLQAYPTEAILGTLAHYGVTTDEAAFRALADKLFPIEVAQGWDGGWKGTGQFKGFHWEAADVLYRRFFPDRLAPSEFAEAVGELIALLGVKLTHDPSAPTAAAFGTLEGLRARVPLENGEPALGFVSEVHLRLGKATQAFSRLSAELANNGHHADALEFAQLEEFLYVVWKGISTAAVRAFLGDKERAEAIDALAAISQDAARELVSRAAAVDQLLNLGALDRALAPARAVFDEAEKGEDLHLAMEVGERLAYALEKSGDVAGRKALEARQRALEAAHAKAHPHHHKH